MTFIATNQTIVGRDADLSEFRSAFESSISDGPRCIIASGEAGVGKTRLITEFCNSLKPEATVAVGQCLDVGSLAAAYSPIIGILRELVRVNGAENSMGDAGPGSTALATLLPELGQHAELNEEFGAARLHESIATLLETMSRRTPLVVVIEDLHWIDSASLNVLVFLLRTITSGRILFILSYRSDDVTRRHPLRSFLAEANRMRNISSHRVERLSKDQVYDLVAQLTGNFQSNILRDSVYQRSEGVPFFVEELVRLDEAEPDTELPDTLRDLLLARYERLSPETQHTLRALSVSGTPVSHRALRYVLPQAEAELNAQLREAIDNSIIVVADDTYMFRHALAREATTTDLLPGESRHFHQQYAEYFESSSSPEKYTAEIAHHWFSNGNAEKAFPWMLAAMRQAHSSYAYGSEAALGEQALELWEDIEDAAEKAQLSRIDLFRQTASAHSNAGNSERALTLLSILDVEQASLDPQERARLFRDKALYLAGLGRDGGEELHQRALELVPPGVDDEFRAGLLGDMASRQMIYGNYKQSLMLANLSLEIAVKIGSRRDESFGTNIRALSLVSTGSLVEGLESLRRSEETAGDDLRALQKLCVNGSDVYNNLGDYERAYELATSGLQVIRRFGIERSHGAILSSNAVEPLLSLGRWDEAERFLTRGKLFDIPRFGVYLLLNEARLKLWRGDASAALGIVSQNDHRVRALSRQEPQTLYLAAGILAQIHLELGNLAEAWSETIILQDESSLDLVVYALPFAAIAARVMAAVRQHNGETPQAVIADEASIRSLEDRIEAILVASVWLPMSSLWSAIARAELSDASAPGARAAAWQKALVEAKTPVAPAIALPYCLIRLAHSLVANGDRDAATDALREALTLSETLGSGLLADSCLSFAQRAGLTLTAQKTSRSSGAFHPLTDREHQVLRLLTEGLTNKQIAEKLFMSSKTASVHVSAILRKLDVSTRTQAATAATERGLI